MNIELFPSEKSCEQGCSICPLARKDTDRVTTEINPTVQRTFSLLETLLNKHKVRYDFHFSAALHLFPTLKHPELMRMARFETRKDFTASDFSRKIENLLSAHLLDPSVLGFSVVPNFPLVTEHDGDKISAFLQATRQWFFDSKEKRKIEVTVRSNLIKVPLFDMVSPFLSHANNEHLLPILQQHNMRLVHNKADSVQSFMGGKIHVHEYSSKKGNKSIDISNRVIGYQKPANPDEFYEEQLALLYPSKSKDTDVLIAPNGVMMMHSSLAINNPLMWISHRDFRLCIKDASRKKNFSSLQFVREILAENNSMYKVLNKIKKQNIEITSAHIVYLFEKWRHKWRSQHR